MNVHEAGAFEAKSEVHSSQFLVPLWERGGWIRATPLGGLCYAARKLQIVV